MVRNALRKELDCLLDPPPGRRMPAVRRSLRDDWIYATDLPALYGGSIPVSIGQKLSGAGWEYAREGNWLQLRKTADEPPENWYSGEFGPEAQCCLSLLRRHSSAAGETAERQAVQRMLIRAGEEGREAYEEACAALHREWAERLRLGRQLPAVSRRYFGE